MFGDEQRKILFLVPADWDKACLPPQLSEFVQILCCDVYDNALTIAQEEEPDLVMIESQIICQPNFDLYQFTETLFAAYQIPVLAFGQRSGEEMLSKILAVGGLGYIDVSEPFWKHRTCITTWFGIADRFRKTHQMLQEKDEFLLMVSHDLKNPLGRMTFASGILSEMPVLKRDAYSNQLIQQVVLSTDEMTRMIKMLTSISEMDSLSGLNLSVVNIQDMLTGIVKNYEFLARLKGIHLDYQGLEQKVLVEVDPLWMEHAVSNLMSNAIKFTLELGEVKLQLKFTDVGLMIRVSDTGVGIRPMDLPHIFDKFYRSGRVPLKAAEGSGLGLAIVKKAVTRHGGQVFVESEEGKGSVFSIVLPPQLVITSSAFDEQMVHV
jgi:signal transduction histidine kinase